MEPVWALLFLSKGLSPVLFSKLKYGNDPANLAADNEGQNWNKHPFDIPNLTEIIKKLPKWPQLMSWQVLDLRKLIQSGNIEELAQSPILYLSGDQVLQFGEKEIQLLRKYIETGGFIFSVANCQVQSMTTASKSLSKRCFPKGKLHCKGCPKRMRSIVVSTCLIRKALNCTVLISAVGRPSFIPRMTLPVSGTNGSPMSRVIVPHACSQ